MARKRIIDLTTQTELVGDEYLVIDGNDGTFKLSFDDFIEQPFADLVNVYGAKNLLPYPYYVTTQTVNGITFTDNGDGTITANGTATATATLTLIPRTVDYGINLEVGGSYTLTGCPNGGSLTTYDLNFGYTESGAYARLALDYGEGSTFALTQTSETYYTLSIVIRSGQTVSDLVFKPMLRCASIANGEYRSYAMTNQELTEKVNDIIDAIVNLGGSV